MDTKTNCYEGMFLLDAGHPNMEAALAPIHTVLGRSEAEILSIKPWDERKLAYEIEGRRRGLYILTYFKMDPEKVTKLERDCQLNEEILRMMLLRKDQITDDMIEADTPATAEPVSEGTPAEEAPKTEAPAAKASAEEAPKAEAPAEEAPAEQPAEAPAAE